MLNYWTQPWYYITLAAFSACLLEVLFGAWPATSKSRVTLRSVRLAVAPTDLRGSPPGLEGTADTSHQC